MFELTPYIDAKRDQVNTCLEGCLNDAPQSGRLIDAMRYSLMAGGKRLRPILCLASTEAVGGRPENSLSAACALEMIHTYSLIHDDLPAMDNDDLRRGKPTCHVAFDEATAILAGDALLTMAFQVLSSISKNKVNLAPKKLAVLHLIARAGGHQGMIEGQMRDIASENTVLSRDMLEELHGLKTGALIKAAVHSGALLGDGSVEQVNKLCIYANNIGLAFQIKDDVLNVEGDPALLGKAVGTDTMLNKNTYPSIIGLEKSKALAKELVDKALKALNSFDNRADPLRAIANYIIHRKR